MEKGQRKNSKGWKKAGFFLLAASAVLAGCKGKKEESQPAVTAAQGPLGAYEETLICGMGRSTIANPKFPDNDSYENNAYTRYLKDVLNVEIRDDFEANGADYDRQVSLSVAAGELPDVMKVGSKDLLDELVENELVADLTEVYQAYASDYVKEIYDSYGGRCLDLATYEGRLMAIPGTNLDSAPCVAYIRKDWLDSLELDVDGDKDQCITVEELEKIARAFLEEDPDGSGNPVGMAFAPYLTADDYGSSGYTMNGIASAFGAFPKNWLMGEDGMVYYGSVAPEMKAALAQMAEWFQEGVVDPQFGTRTWDDITALLTNGQTGIVFGPWHIPDWLLNNVRGMNPNADFSAYVVADGDGKVNVTHSNASNGYMVVRKGYSNPEVLVKMVNLYFDQMVNSTTLNEDYPEVGNYISQGVDGTARPIPLEINAYTSLLDDFSDIRRCLEGEITMDQVRTAESRSVVESVERYLADPKTAEVSDWAKYVSRMEGIALIDGLTREEKMNWVTPAFWGITETMESNNASLGTLEEENFVAFVTGAKDIDQFDTFVEQWKEQGGEQITREVQEAVMQKGE